MQKSINISHTQKNQVRKGTRQNSTSLRDKSPDKIKYKRIMPQHSNATFDKPTTNNTEWEKTENIYSKIRNKTRVTIFATLIQCSTRNFSQSKLAREIKGT